MSIPSIAVEAALIALPDDDATADDLTIYIDRLLQWSELLDEGTISLRLSETTTQALFDSNRFPHARRIDGLFRKRSLEAFDGTTVARIINRLLELTPSLEKETGTSELLIDDFISNPDVSSSLDSCAPLRQERIRCIGYIVAVKPMVMPTHPVVLVSSEAKHVSTSVSFTLHDAECIEPSIKATLQLPRQFNNDVALASAPISALLHFNEVEIWLNALRTSQVNQLMLAIRCSVLKMAKRINLSASGQLRKFSIHKEFPGSVRNSGADTEVGLAGRALRSISETILMQRLSNTHALREGAGPTMKQQSRGKDLAWRRDIDYEFHLHYWECERGGVEIASVVVHNDFTIPR